MKNLPGLYFFSPLIVSTFLPNKYRHHTVLAYVKANSPKMPPIAKEQK